MHVTVEKKNYRMFVNSQLTELERCFGESRINSPSTRGLKRQYGDYNVESLRVSSRSLKLLIKPVAQTSISHMEASQADS